MCIASTAGKFLIWQNFAIVQVVAKVNRYLILLR